MKNMVLIPTGNLEIGSVNAFYIDTHRARNLEYQQFLDENPQWQKVLSALNFPDLLRVCHLPKEVFITTTRQEVIFNPFSLGGTILSSEIVE